MQEREDNEAGADRGLVFEIYPMFICSTRRSALKHVVANRRYPATSSIELLCGLESTRDDSCVSPGSQPRFTAIRTGKARKDAIAVLTRRKGKSSTKVGLSKRDWR